MKRVPPPGESTKHRSSGGEPLSDNDGRTTVGLRSQADEQLHTIGLFHRSLRCRTTNIVSSSCLPDTSDLSVSDIYSDMSTRGVQ